LQDHPRGLFNAFYGLFVLFTLLPNVNIIFLLIVQAFINNLF